MPSNRHTYLALLLLLCSFLSASGSLQWMKVNTNTNQLVNEDGVAMIFHGVNAVYKISPWIPDTTHWDVVSSFTDRDAKDLHDWGFNIVRLGIMWPGVRPEPNKTNVTYLAEVAKIVNKLGENGIYTLLDFHQDLLSRFGCGEGAPDYLMKDFEGLKDFPSPVHSAYSREPGTDYPTLKECLSNNNFGEYYMTRLVNSFFTALYTEDHPIHTELHAYWRAIAEYFYTNPNVVGYDLVNEPAAGNLFTNPLEFINVFGGTGRKYLQALHESLHTEIRKVDQRHILFFESALNNGPIFSGFTQGPGGAKYRDRQVFSHHVYCPMVDLSGCVKDGWHWFCEIYDSILYYLRSVEIKKWGCGGLLTEFGALCEEPNCLQEVARVQGKADDMLEGWVYWQFKEYHDLSTANTDFTEGLYYVTGELQKKKLTTLTRPYARKIAGSPTQMHFDTDSAEYTLKYEIQAETSSRITEIYANKAYYGGKRPQVAVTPAGTTVDYIDVTSKDGSTFVSISVRHAEGLALGTVVEVKLTKA